MITKELDFTIHEPNILDEKAVLEMQQEFFNTNCKFNGTSDLNLFNNYIDWLANTINQTHCYNFNNMPGSKLTYLATINHTLVGMLEIVCYTNINNINCAHIIECIRPFCRRLGYSKPLLKKAIEECNSFGIRKNNITFEYNNKASSDTMTKIMDF